MPDAQMHEVQALFVRHTGVIRGFILGLVPDFATADDVLQETFLTITAKAGEFTIGTNFVGWACSIAANKARETARKSRLAMSLSPEVIDALAAAAPEAPHDEEVAAALERCVAALAPQARRIIELRYRDAQTPGQIAEEMRWTADSVYVALSRARTALRDCLRRKLLLKGDEA